MRPVLGVADVFRRHGTAFRDQHDEHLGRVERRVMAAIEVALGARGVVSVARPHRSLPIPSAGDLRFKLLVPILDRLLAALRRYGQTLPDGRRGKNTTYSMADFALAAFAPFFMQSPSFLAHQRYLETGQGRSNCQTLFGMAKIPCDNQTRAMLDPVEPTHFYPMFADVIAELEQSGGLDAMRCLDRQVLIALDGTEYHCSQQISCSNCSHRKRGKDNNEYFHSMLAATIVAPGHTRAVPLATVCFKAETSPNASVNSASSSARLRAERVGGGDGT
jgi:hypothetical protein